MDENKLTATLPGFDEPLALLRACHTKILAHCDLLERAITQLAENKEDEEARSAARKVVTYFSTSARLHHLDEENDLFPLLARQSLKLADLIHLLKQEHEQLDALWQVLEPGLKQLPDETGFDAFTENAMTFCQLSRQHVKRENMEFLPLAASSLNSQQLKDIGIAMAGRRGVRYPG